MKEFVEFVAKFLVDSPESVHVEVTESGENHFEYTLKVADDDIGRVIGKQGKIAQSMRLLLKAASAKEGKRATLKILD